MKIVLDNIIYSNDSKGAGISNYWFELSQFLLTKQQDELYFYEDKDAGLNFHRKQLKIPQESIIVNSNSSSSSIVRRLAPVKFAMKDYFLFHSSYYRSLAGNQSHCDVTTVHDFTHNFFATPLKRMLHNKSKYKSIRNANGIICISESTYKDLQKFCPPTKNQKVEIIPNGVGADYYKVDRNIKEYQDYIAVNNIKSPYILYVGSRVNYKNFAFIVQLLKEMPAMGLVIVGGQLSANEIKSFDQNLLSRTVCLSNVSNFNLNLLYNFAHAFLYPSSYEGFGIPIIEAMRAGCPAVALNNSSVVEVAGNAGILLNLLDINEFKNAINKLFEANYRNEIIEKGLNHSKQYSWERCCAETYAFYKSVY